MDKKTHQKLVFPKGHPLHPEGAEVVRVADQKAGGEETGVVETVKPLGGGE